MTEDILPHTGSPNGTRFATLPPDLAERAAMIEAVMEQAWQQLNARDASAEQHKWIAYGVAGVAALLLLIALALVALLAWDRRDVQAFVQVVQVTEEGHLVQVGVPKKLLDYEPQEGAWMAMLSQWTKHVNWRGDDMAKAEHEEWRWVALHTCPSARPALDALKKRDRPFKKTPANVSVTIKSITKLPHPTAYEVQWEKLTTGPGAPTGKSEVKSTTFTVGRIAFKTLAETQENRLGICVASFNTDER